MLTRHPIAVPKMVGLYPRLSQEACATARAVAQQLVAHGVETMICDEVSSVGSFGAPQGARLATAEELARGADLVIALGGDGTLLRAARLVAARGIPVMGINLGTLGFLSAYGVSQIDQAIEATLGGSLVWEPRLRMDVHVRGREGAQASQTACNDVYIKHGERPRMLALETHIGGEKIAEYYADGLIASTPMGSTAYNLAAGGPIVDAGAHTFTITPICPHSLTHRPVVTSADNHITIAFRGPADAGPAVLSADGQWSIPLHVGDSVHISRASTALQLVPPPASVFEVLSHKLAWNAR
jgi:NAD+ kinase